MSEYLPIYLCISSGRCLLHQSHPLTATTAASCQRRSAAAEGKGRSAKPRLTASVLAEGSLEWEGGLVNRTSGSHLDQREAHGSGTGRRPGMPRRKWEVMSVCMFMSVFFFNACLIIAAMLIPAAL